MSREPLIAARLARWLVRHAAWSAPRERKAWLRAMGNELDQTDQGPAAVRWALGCVAVSYCERVRSMNKISADLPRWLLCVEMAVCFIPLTWLFLAVVNSMVHGHMSLADSVRYGSVALLGPLGLAIALRMIVARTRAVAPLTFIVLALLAAWTVCAYTGQLLHNRVPFVTLWREWVLIAVLPALAVLHLLHINLHRRAVTTAA